MQDKKIKYGTQYIVESGDNLYSISKRFHTEVETLKKINNLVNESLEVGQIIYIDDIYNPKNPPFKKYIVKENDTIFQLAFNYNMTVNELMELNNLETVNLNSGQEILVKNMTSKLNENIIYKVEKGDTIYSIAKKYNMTVNELMELNNKIDTKVSLNEKLVIGK